MVSVERTSLVAFTDAVRAVTLLTDRRRPKRSTEVDCDPAEEADTATALATGEYSKDMDTDDEAQRNESGSRRPAKSRNATGTTGAQVTRNGQVTANCTTLWPWRHQTRPRRGIALAGVVWKGSRARDLLA